MMIRGDLKYTLLAILLCLPVAVFPEASPETGSRTKIGMLLTLSGSFASAGEDCRQGIDAALIDSPMRDKLELIFADSKNEPSTAISEFRRLTSLSDALAVYTHRSSIGMPLNPISRSTKIPVLGAVGHKDYTQGNEYAFQIWPRSDLEGSFVAENFVQNGLKRVAMIYTEDEWTGAIADGFRDKLKKVGGTLLSDEPVLLSERDFRTVLLRIKQKSPDAIYLNILLPQIGVAVKQARQIGIKTELFSNFYTSRSDVFEAAGEALEGVKYVEMDTNLPTLKRNLGLSSDAAPQGLTVASYVATLLLSQAVSSVQGPVTSSSLYEALLTQESVEAPDHSFKVNDRYVEFPLVVKQIRNGKGRLVREG